MSRHYPSQGFSRRTFAVGGIVSLHVLVIYMFMTGLAIKLLPPVPAIKVDFTDIPRDKPTVPPPPQPTMQRFQVPVVPIPETIVDPVTPDDRGITVVPRPPIPDPTPAEDFDFPPPVRVIGQNHLPNTEDYYPPDMRRQGIEGSTVVRACVDEKGTLVKGSPTVEQSSGQARLYAGALNVAHAGRYARSVQGTRPVPNCFRFKVDFQMSRN